MSSGKEEKRKPIFYTVFPLDFWNYKRQILIKLHGTTSDAEDSLPFQCGTVLTPSGQY